MSETKPTTEQVRFTSDLTGEHDLNAYLQACERDGVPLYEMLDKLFDTDGEIFNVGLFEFRITSGPSYSFQYRVGPFVDPDTGWADISEDVFTAILSAASASQSAAASSASAASTSASNASSSASAAASSASDASDSAVAAQAAQSAAEAAAAGMKARPPVKCATTANITLSGTQTIDGISAIAGDRVLVKNQSSPATNGVYVVAAGSWTRATDADTWAELVGQIVTVEQGSTNADFTYLCTADSGGTLGTTAVTWAALTQYIPDSAVGYVKIASSAIATAADIVAGTASKLTPADQLRLLLNNQMIVQDQKAGGTAGGSSVATTWTARTLNTTVRNTITGASLSSNQITLPVGTYRVYATSPHYFSRQVLTRLRNITDGTTAIVGTTEWSDDGVDDDSVRSVIHGVVTVSGSSKAFEVQYYSNTARATDGLGQAAPAGAGEVSVFTDVYIERIA